MKNKRKRLNLSVKRQLQMWLLYRIFGVVVLSSVVAALLLYVYSHREISSSFYLAHIHIRRVSDLLLPVMVTGSLVSLISGMVLALFLPQRLAGPIYRIEKSLEVIRGGDLTARITLRRNDALLDVAGALNETVAGLGGRVQAVKDAHEDLARCVAASDPKGLAAALDRQKVALDQLRTR